MKRFAIHPGWVTSEEDGDQYIGYEKLIELYKLDYEECFNMEWTVRKWRGHFVHIYPRNDGNYPLTRDT